MKLKFECDTKNEKDAADRFLTWLCEQGEQDYWNWMGIREEESLSPITIFRFNYDFKKKEAGCDIGRLDDPEKE